MKKVITLILTLMFTISSFSLVACGGESGTGDGGGTTTSTFSLEREKISLNLGNGRTLKYEASPDLTGAVEWSSSAPEIVSVNSSGRVTANKIGSAVITAKLGGFEDTCTVTVNLANNQTPSILLKSGIYDGAVIKLGDYSTIENAITYNALEYTDAEWTYSIKDPSIVEITDGKIKGKKVGSTEITVKASWRGVQSDDLTKTVKVSVKQFDKSNTLSYTDTTYFNQYGRTYTDSNGLVFDLSGTAIEFYFYGTALTMNALVTKTSSTAVRVFIDNDAEGKFITLKNTTLSEVVLAENLNKSAHYVRIVKASPQDLGVFAVKEFKAESFAKPNTKSDLYIEFVGDSITVGYSVLDDGQGSQSVSNTDATKTFAYLTAKNLNADYSMVCMQGITVNTKYNLSYSMTDLYNWYSANKRDAFTDKNSPDVVVINLGTNDSGYLNTHQNHNLANDYVALLDQIRAKHKNAYIIITYGMMSTNNNVMTAINDAISTVNDEKITFVKPADPSGSGHPTKQVNIKTAEILTNYIKGLLG